MCRRGTWLAGALAGMLVAACASAGGSDGGGADGSIGDFPDAAVAPDAPIGFPDAAPGADAAPVPDAAPGAPDAMPLPPDAAPPADAAPITTTLTQTTSDSITADNAVACVNSVASVPVSTALNRYFRVFDLPALGINSGFAISQISIGVESASSDTGSQSATVVVYTVSGTGAPTLASLTQIASKAITIVDQTQQLLNVALTATVPAGSRLAIELSSPDGPDGKFFFFGSNGAGESAPAYMVAPDCGITEMTSAASLNTTNTMHLVMKVTGTYQP